MIRHIVQMVRCNPVFTREVGGTGNTNYSSTLVKDGEKMTIYVFLITTFQLREISISGKAMYLV